MALFKERRGLLLGGDLVRLDFPEPAYRLHGVVAPDRSAALYAVVAMAVSDVVHVGRLPLPGLDPERRYRVRPIKVGQRPRGLVAPSWWGGPPAARGPGHPPDPDAYRSWPEKPLDGVVLSGAVLGAAGLMAPALGPEQAVLLEAYAVD